MATGPGETGNVIAAIASLILPGLGQLIQGRLLAAVVHFVIGSLLYLSGYLGFFLLCLAFFFTIYSCYNAATYWHN